MSRNLAIIGTLLAAAAVVGVTAVAPSLSFGSAGFLAGLAAAALPVIIHLINRRRARVRAFAAIDFILSSNKRVAQKLKLRQLLLLLVRTLLIACVPLALSKPSYETDRSGLTVGTGPSATAIILDDSLSMAYRLEGKPLFARARSRALAYLRELPREATAVALLGSATTARAASKPPAELTFDHAQVRARLEKAQVGPWRSNLEDAVRRADRLLATSPLEHKRIVVLTDLARHAWPNPSTSLPLPSGAQLYLHDVSRGATLPNRAIVAVHVTPDPDLGPGGQRIAARIASYAERPTPGVRVDLRLDGRVVARGVIDLPARGTVEKVFHHRLPTGRLIRGAVALQGDALPEDDIRSFAVDVRPPARVLLVNGDPRQVPYLDELFYLERALRPQGSAVRLRIVPADEKPPTPLKGFGAVFLCNVRELSARRVSEIRAFVRGGGGLFISVGDKVQPDYYNALWGDLLPRRLRSLRDVTYGGGAPVRFARPKLEHPILAIFAGAARDGLVSGQARRYMNVDPGPESQVLLSFDDGAPALLAGRVGRGHTLLFTTTVDRDWTDLPIRTAFLPLMQQTARFLAGKLAQPGAAQVLVGQTRTIDVGEEGAQEVLVEGPGGLRVRFASDALHGRRTLPFRRTDRTGVYRIQLVRRGRPEPGGAFAVNPSPVEADLTKLTARQVAKLAPRRVDPTASVVTAAVGRTALWPWIALALLLFLLVEAVLVRRA